MKMNLFNACGAMIGIMALFCSTSHAQLMSSAPLTDSTGAPESVVGMSVTLTAKRGTTPFASSGDLRRVFTSAASYEDFVGTNTTPVAQGKYVWTRAMPQQGVLLVAPKDSDGLRIQVMFKFTSAESGTYMAILPGQKGSMQTGDFALTSSAPTTASNEPTASDKLREDVKAKGVKDSLAGEAVFNRLFSSRDKIEPLSRASLAFLYEARVHDPDFATLAELSLDEVNRIYANDEFRKRDKIKENLPKLAAKLNKASERVVIAFDDSATAPKYDFKAGGFPVMNPDIDLHVLKDFPYAMEIVNTKEAQFFKVPEKEAQGVAFDRRAWGDTHNTTFYGVVEGLGKPRPGHPKIIKVRVIGMDMDIGGKSSMGFYNLQTETWKESYKLANEVKEQSSPQNSAQTADGGGLRNAK